MADFYKFTSFKDYPGCVHLITAKSVLDPYAFSLALHTGEDPEAIIENRKKLSLLLGRDNHFHFIVANQTHSENIEIMVEAETRGWKDSESAVRNCDALITHKKGVMLTILTADCVPVLLYDKKKEVVAAIHAGWRGTEAMIVEKTVAKMVTVYGSDPKDIRAGIAPSIGGCCYEVGEDVAKHFFTIPQSMQVRDKKYMLDLPFINRKQLLDAGVLESHIEMSGICTACEDERFFSYRKEQGCSGRFMSMIGLVP